MNKLLLPQRSCADYIRKGELPTISNAHKATVLSECADGFRLNTNGTTKKQRKIGGVGINDVVISVNELSDGTAMSAVKDVSRDLEKLREVAHTLRLPNASRINWTLFISSTSDSAAFQKRLNKLIDDYRVKDQERFGAATVETIDSELVESCATHLGINLRKAFPCGICSEEGRYHPTEKFVHEFCKLSARMVHLSIKVVCVLFLTS